MHIMAVRIVYILMLKILLGNMLVQSLKHQYIMTISLTQRKIITIGRLCAQTEILLDTV